MNHFLNFHEIFGSNSEYFFVLELMEGETLQDELDCLRVFDLIN